MGSSETGGCFDCVFDRMPPASVRPVYGKPQKRNVASAVWKGKRDYAIKPLRRLTAGGRSMVVWLCCRVDKGIFYIAMPPAFMSLKFLKPLIIS